MSASYRAVTWNRTKLVYDAALIAGVGLYLLAYFRLGPMLRLPKALPDDGSLAIRAFGSCAFVLLTLALAIGPLARLDSRFVPLLYNRRHLGVVTFAVATAHLMAVLDWHLAFSPLSPWVAMFFVDSTASGRHLPNMPFGILAYVLMLLLASTSHDFWLNFLGPSAWKSLHMSIYGAYACVVAHVAFGALQDARGAALPAVILGSAVLLAGLHLSAALVQRRRRQAATRAEPAPDGWVAVGPASSFVEGRGRAVILPGGATAAVFLADGKLSAVSNLCAHQNGPLSEGRVSGDRIICPWHGFEYCLRDGRAPAPYRERIRTYRLRLDGEQVSIHPEPLPPGTPVDPVTLPQWAIAGAA